MHRKALIMALGFNAVRYCACTFGKSAIFKKVKTHKLE